MRVSKISGQMAGTHTFHKQREANMRRVFHSITLIACAVVVLAGSLSAQSVYTRPITDNEVVLEFFKPSYKSTSSFSSTPSGFVAGLMGRVQLTDQLHLLFELPYAQGKFEFSSPFFSISENQTTLGNIYSGIEIQAKTDLVFVDVGVRFPTTSESASWASSVAIASDVDRYEAFVPHLLAFNGIVNVAMKTESGFAAHLRAGPTLWVNTKTSSGGSDDTEWLLGYSALAGFQNESVVVKAGYSGRMILTETGPVENRSFHQIGATLGVRLGIIRPMVHAKLPLDKNLKNTLEMVYGFALAIEFN